jgi:hypothetical protein
MLKTVGLPKKTKETKEKTERGQDPLFQYINDLSNDKQYLMNKGLFEKEYNAHQTNRFFSYFSDTVMLSNMMNMSYQLPNNLQHDFYYHEVRKRKRWTKWFKSEKSQDIELIKEYYKYNDQKAREALSILSENQLDDIRKKLNKGGLDG